MAVLLKEYFELKSSSESLNEMKQSLSEGKPLIVKGVIQRAEAKNQNGRVYPMPILKKEMDRYIQEYVSRGIALGELDHCLKGNTEVLTTQGWKTLETVSGEEEVYTLNGNEIELSPILKVHKFFHEGEMIKLTNGKKLELVMTPNHRMMLWDRNNEVYYALAHEVSELYEIDSKVNHSKILSSGEWKGNSNTYFDIPNTEYRVPIKAWAGMFGLWISEGYVAGSKGGEIYNYRIVIVQKKEENIKKIRELLNSTELPWKEYKNKDGKYEWLIHDKQIHSYFSQFGDSSLKFIPQEFLMWNKECLNIMFDWMLIGDGRNRHSPSGELIKEYSTVSLSLANNVSELIFKLGGRPFIKSIQPKDVTIEGRLIKEENCKKLYTISFNKSNTHLDSRFIKFEKIPYNDFVYCISTKNHNFLMRSENGYVCWTGNTDEPVIALKNVSHRLVKVDWDGNDVIGEVQLLNTPAGKIAQEIVLSGIPLGISSRAIGSVSKKEGKDSADVVQPDLQMICFDLVGTPSTDNAFLSMREGKEIKNFNPRKILPPELRIKSILSEILGREI